MSAPKKETKIVKEHKWDDIFKIVIRNAMDKLNIAFRSWQYDFLTDNIDNATKLYIKNNALCLLTEPTVTQYIFSEFIGSPLTNGSFIGKENRHYQIFREHSFTWAPKVKKEIEEINERVKEIKEKKGKTDETELNTTRKIVDFVINRIRWKENRLQARQYPVIIEAKRVSNYSIKDGEYKGGGDNINLIKEDIKYLDLLKEKNSATNKLYEKDEILGFITCILLWDYEIGTGETIKQKVKNNIAEIFDLQDKENELNNITDQIVYIPTHFDPVTLDINTCMWFLLYEVCNPDGKKYEQEYFNILTTPG